MPNTYTQIIPTILARGLASLREKCVMPRLINFDYSDQAQQPGSVITIPVPAPQTAAPVVPSNVPVVPASNTIVSAPLTLNKWNKTEFFLTDQDLGQIDKNQSFFPMQAAESIRALANGINADIFQLYKSVFGFVMPQPTSFGQTTTPAFAL